MRICAFFLWTILLSLVKKYTGSKKSIPPPHRLWQIWAAITFTKTFLSLSCSSSSCGCRCEKWQGARGLVSMRERGRPSVHKLGERDPWDQEMMKGIKTSATPSLDRMSKILGQPHFREKPCYLVGWLIATNVTGPAWVHQPIRSFNVLQLKRQPNHCYCYWPREVNMDQVFFS